MYKAMKDALHHKKMKHMAHGGELDIVIAPHHPGHNMMHNYEDGGKVDGKAKHMGDHPSNDTVHAMLSPGEFVIPKSDMESKHEALAFLEHHFDKKNPHMDEGGSVDAQTYTKTHPEQQGHTFSYPMAKGGEVHKPKLGTGERFHELESKLSHQKGIHNPGALAAHIGREKYGAAKMSKLAHHKK